MLVTGMAVRKQTVQKHRFYGETYRGRKEGCSKVQGEQF